MQHPFIFCFFWLSRSTRGACGEETVNGDDNQSLQRCKIQTLRWEGWKCLIEHLESIHQVFIGGNYCCGRRNDKGKPCFNSGLWCFFSLEHSKENIWNIHWWSLRDFNDGRLVFQQFYIIFFFLISSVGLKKTWKIEHRPSEWMTLTKYNIIVSSTLFPPSQFCFSEQKFKKKIVPY